MITTVLAMRSNSLFRHAAAGACAALAVTAVAAVPAQAAARGSPVLKTGGATRHPDASGPDPTVPATAALVRTLRNPWRAGG